MQCGAIRVEELVRRIERSLLLVNAGDSNR